MQRLADLRQETGVSFVPSLMSQFTPFYRAAEHGLGRRITTYEYRKVVERAIAHWADGRLYAGKKAVPARNTPRRLTWKGSDAVAAQGGLV